MKYILLFLLGSNIAQSYAQNYFIKSPIVGKIDKHTCELNHHIIFDQLIFKNKNLLSKLVIGINEENKANAEKYKIDQYYQLFSELLLSIISLESLKNDLSVNTLSNVNKMTILNPDSISIYSGLQFRSIINQALEENQKRENISELFTEIIIKEVTKETLRTYSKKVFTSIGKSLSGKLVGTTLTKEIFGFKSLLSMGTKIIKESAFVAALEIITEPLKGSRNLPEQDWVDLLKKQPEFLINPEWMNEIGIEDHAWATHCKALQFKTDEMNKILKKYQNEIVDDFEKRIIDIYNNRTADEKNLLTGYRLIEPMETDGTSVSHRYYTPYEDDKKPTWL